MRSFQGRWAESLCEDIKGMHFFLTIERDVCAPTYWFITFFCNGFDILHASNAQHLFLHQLGHEELTICWNVNYLLFDYITINVTVVGSLTLRPIAYFLETASISTFVDQ